MIPDETYYGLGIQQRVSQIAIGYFLTILFRGRGVDPLLRTQMSQQVSGVWLAFGSKPGIGPLEWRG